MFLPYLIQGTEPAYLDSLHTALTRHPGVEISFSLQQIQFEEQWSESGTVEIVGQDSFFIVIGNQAIKMEGRSVSTWNKSSSQLILDALPDEETNIFQLLIGEKQRTKVINQEISGNTISLSLDLETGISAEISITKGSYYPKKVVLDSGEKMKTVLWVQDIKPITEENLFETYDPDVGEVIDLRE